MLSWYSSYKGKSGRFLRWEIGIDVFLNLPYSLSLSTSKPRDLFNCLHFPPSASILLAERNTAGKIRCVLRTGIVNFYPDVVCLLLICGCYSEMAGDGLIEIKFRLFDGTDIGPNKYDSSVTVGSLKESILARWPAGKQFSPKTMHDLKLINAGRILENGRTLAESRVPVGELPGGIITMHVVVRTHATEKTNEKQLGNAPKKNRCQCSIL